MVQLYLPQLSCLHVAIKLKKKRSQNINGKIEKKKKKEKKKGNLKWLIVPFKSSKCPKQKYKQATNSSFFPLLHHNSSIKPFEYMMPDYLKRLNFMGYLFIFLIF